MFDCKGGIGVSCETSGTNGEASAVSQSVTCVCSQGDKPVDAPKGLMALDLNTAGKDGYFYVPDTYSPDVPAPLIVLLHGGSGTGEKGLMTDFEKVKEIASDEGEVHTYL